MNCANKEMREKEREKEKERESERQKKNIWTDRETDAKSRRHNNELIERM